MVDEHAFYERTRRHVRLYLQHHELAHDRLPYAPRWSLPPFVALWLIDSADGEAGWYVIAGDLPTDYVSAAAVKDARDAARHFSRVWSEIADAMQRGEAHPECRIGQPEDWPKLHGLLRTRAELLSEYVANDGLWPDFPIGIEVYALQSS
jgi:hypothetical protein